MTPTHRWRPCFYQLLYAFSKSSSQTWIKQPAARGILQRNELQQWISGWLCGPTVSFITKRCFWREYQKLNSKTEHLKHVCMNLKIRLFRLLSNRQIHPAACWYRIKTGNANCIYNIKHLKQTHTKKNLVFLPVFSIDSLWLFLKLEAFGKKRRNILII